MIYENTHEELLSIIRYLDPDVYDYLIDNPDGLDIGAKSTTITSLVVWNSTKQGSQYWIELSRKIHKFKREGKKVPPIMSLPDTLFEM